MSFPGGRSEAGDLSPVETALRETHGRDRHRCRPLSASPAICRAIAPAPVSTFRRWWACCPTASPWRPIPTKWRKPSRRRWSFFLDPANRRLETRIWGGRERSFYVFTPEGRTIWGATAAILVDFAARLTARVRRTMKIDPSKHCWMTSPETRKLMAALGEGRFVGGAVRNALSGWPVNDIDIAVPMPPEETLQAAGKRGDQGRAHRARAWHDHRHRERPALRSHQPQARRRNRWPPRRRGFHRRLGRGCGAARFHHERALCHRRWRDIRLSRRRARI